MNAFLSGFIEKKSSVAPYIPIMMNLSKKNKQQPVNREIKPEILDYVGGGIGAILGSMLTAKNLDMPLWDSISEPGEDSTATDLDNAELIHNLGMSGLGLAGGLGGGYLGYQGTKKLRQLLGY